MVEVEVFDVLLRERRTKEGQTITNGVVLLHEKDGSRLLPVWLGEAEATAIAMQLQGYQTTRPMTYHFTAALLEAAGVRVESVTISKLVKDTFYATVTVQRGRMKEQVDARPSDAINLALRAGAPIFADEAVLTKAGQRVRLTRAAHEGSSAVVERFQELWQRANALIVEEAGQAKDVWRELGIEAIEEQANPS